MRSLTECRLYAFVDTTYLAGRDPCWVARELCEGGADIIQLRAKNETAEGIRELAESILPIVQDAGVWLVVNDHLNVALQIGAPACHLGQEDFFDAGYTKVAQVVPPGHRLRLGLSSHRPDQAERAAVAGAHYIAVGPVFPTATKPTAHPVTLDYVRWASAHLQTPWFAIGGITLDNVESVLAAGATRVCVVSAILKEVDIRQACMRFRDKLGDRIKHP